MAWMPFICMGIGLLIGLRVQSMAVFKAVDMTVNIALVVLMLTIGLNIGINDNVMQNLGAIGLHCAVIAQCAIWGSVVLVLVVEKTILPLSVLLDRLKDSGQTLDLAGEVEGGEETGHSPLLWLMPLCIISGVTAGFLWLTESAAPVLNVSLVASLVVLYLGVGVGLGSNRRVFGYIKILGVKVAAIAVAAVAGTLLGGFAAGLICRLPQHVSMLSASGLGYYSMTGAFMTSAYGIEAGTYGFMVNVTREFFSVLMLPLLAKISRGSPIASGGAGNMDALLVPISKVMGPEIGLVTLVTGIILSVAVPFLLSLIYQLV